MKRIVAILLLLCAILMVSCGNDKGSTNENMDINSKPSEYSKGLAFTVSEKNPNECIITGIGSCTDKNIIIPASINGKRVAGIAEGAFSPKKQKLALGKEITRVLSAEIHTSTFDGLIFDAYLPSLQNPSDEPYETGTGTPIALEEIESVKIPFTVKTIGDEAFYGCTELESINTHTGLSTIGKDAFKETEYYNDPKNWDGQALYLSNYLLSVSPTYTGEFQVKDGTTMIADQAFYKCTYVTNVNLAESVTTVGSYAFYGCTELKTFSFNYAQVSFANSAFDGCVYYQPVINNQGFIQYPGATPSQPPADTDANKSLYDKIDADAFDRIKAGEQTFFTATSTNKATNAVKTYITNHSRYYYSLEIDGELQRELFADTDENGLVNYMRVDGKWYFTQAEIDFVPPILSVLEFDMLTLSDSENYVYSMTPEENPDLRVEVGFKGGRLAYIGYITEDYTEEIIFDYTKAPVPDIDINDFVPGVIVDASGNPT